MSFHALMAIFWRVFGLGGQPEKKSCRLACKLDLDQSERESSQVNASARKA